MAQTGQNAYAALKVETVLGTVPAVLTGAKKFPINRQAAPRLAQVQIRSGAINADGQRRGARGGSHSVTGSLIGDLTYEHVDMLEAALRGTWASDILTPGVTRRSYTVEVHEQDIDVSTLSKGCRVGGYIQRGVVDQPITHEYPIAGITQEVRTAGAAPVYTSLAAPSEDYMTATDAVLSIGGSPVATVTGWEASLPNGATGVGVVGGKLSPDIFENNLDLTGSISMIRETAAMQQAYIANTPTDLAITAVDLAGNEFLFEYLNLFLADFTQPLGDDGAMIVTIPFTGGKSGADPMVRITRTPAA